MAACVPGVDGLGDLASRRRQWRKFNATRGVRLLELDHVTVKPHPALSVNIVIETMQEESATLHVVLVVNIRLTPYPAHAAPGRDVQTLSLRRPKYWLPRRFSLES